MSGEPTEFPIYVDLHRLFRRGEIWELCSKALQAATGPLTTRELAAHVIAAKGWDRDDGALRKAVAYRIVQALTMQEKRGKVESPGKRKGVRLWEFYQDRPPSLGDTQLALRPAYLAVGSIRPVLLPRRS